MEQAFGIALEVFGLPALVGGLVAAGLLWLGQRYLPERTSALVTPGAVAGGFSLGCLLLDRSTLPLVPEQSGHWLPYLALLVAAPSAALALACKTDRTTALLSAAALACFCGGVLTPAWPIFGKSWPLSIIWLSVYLTALNVSLLILTVERYSRWTLGAMTVTAAALTLAIAALVSVRLAQPAGIAAGALAAALLLRGIAASQAGAAIGGIAPVYALLVGGTAFTAAVEPDPPFMWLLALPLLPLAVGLVAISVPTAVRAPFRKLPD